MTRQAVQQWLSGARGPSEVRRETIEATYAIPREAWAKPVDDATGASNGTPSNGVAKLHALPLGPTSESAYARALKHVARCEAALDANPTASPREFAALSNAVSTAIRALDGATTNWRRILESSEWRLIEGALSERCKATPEIADIVADWLSELRAQAE